MSTLLSGPLRRTRRLVQSEWYAWWRRAPLAGDTVLWSSFDGVGMLCQPRALFDTVLADPRYSHLEHVWITDSELRRSTEVRAVAEHPRVSTATIGSRSYFRALATAHYLVTNTAFPAYFAKRPGQVYLNTWHGLAPQPVSADVVQGRRDAANTLRNFLQADYLLSSGPAMTETLYERAHRLGNLYSGTILEAGSPRMDVQFTAGVRERLRTELARHGVGLATDRLALVAPAWPGQGPAAEPPSIGRLRGCVTTLRDAIGPDWTVLLAVPPHTARALDPHDLADDALRGAVVPAAVSPNLVLAATDLLVTAPSSLLIDYLPRDRPAIVIAPDGAPSGRHDWRYPSAEDWPAPVVGDLDELAVVASRIAAGHDDCAHTRQAWLERLCPLEDGAAAARVVDVVFGGRADAAVSRRLQRDGRTRLLLHLGGMQGNGITSSALNLLRNIDHERVDVTCFFQDSSNPERLRSARGIDRRCRILMRTGGFTATLPSFLRARAAYRTGVGDPDDLPADVQAVFAEEWRRCFGSAQFDRIADFSGYGAMWGLILLAGPAPLHGTWLHNDMLADADRTVEGRRPLHKRLYAEFSLYRSMDRLVSVSPSLCDVNRAKLARFAPAERFVSARNSLDFDRIDRLAAGTVAEEDTAALAIMAWLADRADTVVFVSSARLSSEKNHERLIRAFAEVHQSHPTAALLILGEGVLHRHLERLVAELGLDDHCLMAGFQPNPFQFMKHCQCFVLSSDHEGQPMGILEALHLGLEVITTRFSSVDSALPPGVGLIVERDVPALAEGMRSYLRGDLGPVDFDSASYNEAVLAEFYQALDIP